MLAVVIDGLIGKSAPTKLEFFYGKCFVSRSEVWNISGLCVCGATDKGIFNKWNLAVLVWPHHLTV